MWGGGGVIVACLPAVVCVLDGFSRWKSGQWKRGQWKRGQYWFYFQRSKRERDVPGAVQRERGTVVEYRRGCHSAACCKWKHFPLHVLFNHIHDCVCGDATQEHSRTLCPMHATYQPSTTNRRPVQVNYTSVFVQAPSIQERPPIPLEILPAGPTRIRQSVLHAPLWLTYWYF